MTEVTVPFSSWMAKGRGLQTLLSFDPQHPKDGRAVHTGASPAGPPLLDVNAASRGQEGSPEVWTLTRRCLCQSSEPRRSPAARSRLIEPPELPETQKYGHTVPEASPFKSVWAGPWDLFLVSDDNCLRATGDPRS